MFCHIIILIYPSGTICTQTSGGQPHTKFSFGVLRCPVLPQLRCLLVSKSNVKQQSLILYFLYVHVLSEWLKRLYNSIKVISSTSPIKKVSTITTHTAGTDQSNYCLFHYYVYVIYKWAKLFDSTNSHFPINIRNTITLAKIDVHFYSGLFWEYDNAQRQ